MAIITKMPFGKYKGWDIEDLPLSYMVWCVEQDYIKDDLREALTDAIDFLMPSNNFEISAAKVKQCYRQLAIKYHPDKGGNDEAMKAVNEFYEILTRR